MDTFKRTLEKRIAAAAAYNALVLLVLVTGIIHLATGANEHVRDFIAGVNLGFCVGIQAVALYYMGKYIAAIKNTEKLKKLYIEENDERTRYIHEKTGGMGINIVIGGLAVAMLASGYFNETVFFTLLGASMFAVLVKMTLRVYYVKKY